MNPETTTRNGDSPSDRRLLLRFAATRDPQDRDRLVERYLPLARYAAGRYAHGARDDTYDDLLQIACVGLLKSIDRFDPHTGVLFTSYAMPTMLGELRRHFRDHGWAVRPPRTLQEHALRVERTTDELVDRLGRSPSIREVATASGLAVEDVLEAREAIGAHVATSLAAPVSRGGTGDVTELGELLGGEDPGYERAEAAVVVHVLLGVLDAREREILRLRLEEDLTQSEIGHRVGLSQMHVSRILRETLAKLRRAAAQRPAPADETRPMAA